MADPGDGQALLGGCGREQGSGSAEEDLFQLAGAEFAKELSAEGDGAAAAAGTPGVDILGGVVKYHGAAVRQLAPQGQAVPAGKLQEHFLADLAEISGDDEVKVLRAGVKVHKMAADGGEGGGG